MISSRRNFSRSRSMSSSRLARLAVQSRSLPPRAHVLPRPHLHPYVNARPWSSTLPPSLPGSRHLHLLGLRNRPKNKLRAQPIPLALGRPNNLPHPFRLRASQTGAPPLGLPSPMSPHPHPHPTARPRRLLRQAHWAMHPRRTRWKLRQVGKRRGRRLRQDWAPPRRRRAWSSVSRTFLSARASSAKRLNTTGATTQCTAPSPIPMRRGALDDLPPRHNLICCSPFAFRFQPVPPPPPPPPPPRVLPCPAPPRHR